MNNYIEKRIQKLSVDKSEIQLKMDLYSTMVPFLLSTEWFTKNSDIRNFTDKLNLKKEMKDYLFSSRTQVVARMIREIDNFDEEKAKENIKIFKKYIFDDADYNLNENNIKKASRQSKEEEKILKMMNKYSRNKGKTK